MAADLIQQPGQEDPLSRPLAGVSLYLTYAAGKDVPPKARATTGPDGRFRLTVDPAELDRSAVQDPWSTAQVVATGICA